MEDDGFLLSVLIDFVDRAAELFHLGKEKNFKTMVERLVERNEPVIDQGSSLPIYLPLASDDGQVVASRQVPVWSGTHIGFPLYPGMARNSVESFLYGNPRRPGRLGEEFLATSDAFRLALLVHYVCENVLIPALSAEAFLLGAYDQVPFHDDHYEETGLPTTYLTIETAEDGLRLKRTLAPNGCLQITHGMSMIEGWTIRVRGARPKEATLKASWQHMRERVDAPPQTLFTIEGQDYQHEPSRLDIWPRQRSGSPDVDFLVAWVDAALQSGQFPMRGTRCDWRAAKAMFELQHPRFAGYWSADTMRRTYKRRKTD